MKKTTITLLFFIFPVILKLYSAAPPVLKLELKRVQKDAINNSSRIKALESEYEALKCQVSSQYALLLPKLNFDATGRYVTEVPSLTLPVFGNSEKKLSDNFNYSVGPSINYIAWDGSIRNNYKSIKNLAESKLKEIENAEKQVILTARVAYLQVQLASEQLKLVADYVNLAQAQYNDINLNYKSGAKSKIDELMASQELSGRKKQFNQARIDFSLSLRELFAITGEVKELNVSLPLPEGINIVGVENIDSAGVYISLDSIENLSTDFQDIYKKARNPEHPVLVSLDKLAESYKNFSESYKSNLFPKVQLSAKTSIDYPNGPDFTNFNQNVFSASAVFPLFEFNRSKKQSEEQSSRAVSVEKRREQAEKEILRDWNKATDQISVLKIQQEINAQYIKESQELLDLVYGSYKVGRSTFLELQNANLKSLDAKIQSVRTDIQILIQLAVLDSMSK